MKGKGSHTPLNVKQPGQVLQDILDEQQISPGALAARIGATECHIKNVINGTAAITDTLAYQLQRALGIDAEFWINTQTQYNKKLALVTRAKLHYLFF